MSPIANSSTGADIDCSPSIWPVRIGVAGDFNGDGRDEIAFGAQGPVSVSGSGWTFGPPAPSLGHTIENDFWIMQWTPAVVGPGGAFTHLSPIPGHGIGADLDLSPLNRSALHALAADYLGVGRKQLTATVPYGVTALPYTATSPALIVHEFWTFDSSIRAWHQLQLGIAYQVHDLNELYAYRPYPLSGDFDGDGRAELAFRKDTRSDTVGNDYWVFDIDPQSRKWAAPTDFDCSVANIAAKFAVVGDFDGDGRDEIAVAQAAPGTVGNDFWVIKLDQPPLWHHLGPAGSFADFDCSVANIAAKFAVVGDFDGDGRDEIAIAKDALGVVGNEFWVMKLARSGQWQHLGAANAGAQFDFRCSSSNVAAKFAVVGDFDGDGRDEIAIAQDLRGTAGNDFWVMKFDPQSGQWQHLGPAGSFADFDCSTADYAAQFAVVGDFDGDGRDEIAIANDAQNPFGNDVWVMKYV